MAELAFLSVDDATAADLEWPDVYFTPAYGHACEASDGASWEVAVGAGGGILFPYLRRAVDSELCGSDAAFDIVSPYGYAGTWVAPGVGQAEVTRFRDSLRAALAARGGVAEFHRTSGLVPGRAEVAEADPALVHEQLHDTVAIDLSRGYEACWAAAEGRSRTKTRKALKKGYSDRHRVASSSDLSHGGAFRDLYESTMRRVDARPYYLFPNAYYERLQAGLGADLGLVEILDPEGAVSGAGIYFVHGALLHLHLVGSTRDSQRDGAGNLLYDSVIRYGCERGMSTLHVGGGMAADDAMFKFKRSFGGHRVPFHVARGILDPTRYETLVAARAAATERTVEAVRGTGYFPAYRG
ncbi:MAG: hypothetical protein ACI8PZ_004315 [Myxococcota bacterium]|jgi:hypothetical protein